MRESNRVLLGIKWSSCCSLKQTPELSAEPNHLSVLEMIFEAEGIYHTNKCLRMNQFYYIFLFFNVKTIRPCIKFYL